MTIIAHSSFIVFFTVYASCISWLKELYRLRLTMHWKDSLCTDLAKRTAPLRRLRPLCCSAAMLTNSKGEIIVFIGVSQRAAPVSIRQHAQFCSTDN